MKDKESNLVRTGTLWLEKAKAWASRNTKLAVAAVTIAVPAGLLMIGGYLITTAVVFAVVSVAAFGFLVYKLHSSDHPLMNKVYDLLIRFKLATDVGFTILVYMLSPGGIIGMLGAGVACLLASGVLILAPERSSGDEEALEVDMERGEERVNEALQPVPQGS